MYNTYLWHYKQMSKLILEILHNNSRAMVRMSVGIFLKVLSVNASKYGRELFQNNVYCKKCSVNLGVICVCTLSTHIYTPHAPRTNNGEESALIERGDLMDMRTK